MKWLIFFVLGGAVPVFAQEPGQHGHPPARGHMPRDTVNHRDTTMAESARLHEQHAMARALGIPMSREGSGTSWLPDSTPMYMQHGQFGSWDLMLHGNVFLQYIDEGSDRGDDQFGSINWLMGMAHRRLWGGDLMLRAMFSVEPWTVGDCGYPDLLATGETCDGQPLHDRQHPHDLFMELAASFQYPVDDDIALELYGGPVAEPALGPTAYAHRISAFPNPLAPITHHWLDATHITFGAITAGVFGRRWKVEGSLFNGREPDEDRTDLDLAPLKSYSGRIAFNPTALWSLQVSAGRLNEAEAAEEPDGERADVTRVTASAIHHRPLAGRTFLAAMLAYGHNVEHGTGTNAILAEAAINFKDRHVMSGRFEWVEKTGEDLDVDDADLDDDDVFRVARASVAYVYQLPAILGWTAGIGAGGSIAFIPEDLEPLYGETHAPGFVAFVSVRPKRRSMSSALSH